MNKLFTKSALSVAIALSIVACGGGSGGGMAGIGGSGFISSGSVTGFGSVFVNGIKFETDSATFDIDGNDGTQMDLAIGMLVRVNGTINDDGISGNASHISFDDELQGPVSSLNQPDPDGITRSFVVLGITVFIDSSSTSFDISDDDIPDGTVFDFDTISADNNVEISGFFDSNGNIQATRVELKDIIFETDSEVEIKGTISDVNGSTFKLGGLTVDATNAALENLANGPENGLYVEVEGTLNASKTTIFATDIEAEDNSIADTDVFELEGLITDYVSDSNFKISGISIDASNAVLEPSTLTLENDLRIEADGAIVNGKLIATEIELEGGDVKIHAAITSINSTTNSFKVRPVASLSEITVTVTSGTQIEDDESESTSFTLNDLLVNDFVEIRGYENGSGVVTAVEIDVDESDDIILQGNATAATGDASGGSITVLGVSYTFDTDTEFEKNDDSDMSNDEINALINTIQTSSPQLIRIEDDEPADGVADEIEIE